MTPRDKIGLTHKRELVLSSLRKTTADIQHKAGIDTRATTEQSDDSLRGLIDASCVDEVYSHWCSTRDRSTRDRFEAVILGQTPP